MDYLYDGTFEGLLTCIHHHYYTEKATGIFTRENYQMNLLGGFMVVETDQEKADTVYEAMEEKISHFAVRSMYKAFLSTVPNKEMKILNFAVMGFRTGPKFSYMHGNDTVIAIETAVRQVGNEAERMRQFVRFSEMEGGVLYGEIEPDHDVIELLATHFCDRYKNEPFIIRDVGRDKALVAYHGDWYITHMASGDLPEYSRDESGYRKLWKNYFDHIAIKERINPRCQANHLPLRYRKHLVEFQLQTNDFERTI